MSHAPASPETRMQAKPESIWRNRNFVILFITGAITGFGSTAYELALPLILYEISKSSVIMGTMRAIEFLPNLLLAAFIGVFVDRMRKKRLMQFTLAMQIIFLVAFYLLISNGLTYYSVFFLTGFVLMTCNYTYGNVRVSIVKHTIPKHLLTSANAKFSLVTNFLSVMGPVITGLILFLAHPSDGLLITAVALTCALIMSQFVQMEQDEPRKNATFWQDLKEGWTALRSNKPLFQLTMMVAVRNSAEGMFSAMVVFYAKDTLQLNNSQLGLVFACAGVGGLIGSSLVPRLRDRFPMGRLYGTMILLIAASYMVMYFAKNVWMMGLSMGLVAVFGIIAAICTWTFRQETTPQHLMGRISGITGSLFKLGLPFAVFGSGWIADSVGATYTFMGAAILNVILFLFFIRLPLWNLK